MSLVRLRPVSWGQMQISNLEFKLFTIPRLRSKDYTVLWSTFCSRINTNKCPKENKNKENIKVSKRLDCLEMGQEKVTLILGEFERIK